jgi:transcriptional regulator with XRE-family HTH domain
MVYRNHHGQYVKRVMKPSQSLRNTCYAPIVPLMVTKPARAPQTITLTTPKLYLREWRKHCSISATEMADKLAIERESVYRLEREQWRVSADDMLIYAQACKIDPSRLWEPPGGISLDELLRDLPEESRPIAIDMAAGILRRFANRG